MAQPSEDVLRGTDIRTDATFDTQPTVHDELLIRDQVFGKEATQQPRVDARPMADNEMADFPVVDDVIDITSQLGSRLVFLRLLFLRSIDIEERQAQIRLPGMMSEKAAWSGISFTDKSLRRISIVSPMLSPAVQRA